MRRKSFRRHHVSFKFLFILFVLIIVLLLISRSVLENIISSIYNKPVDIERAEQTAVIQSSTIPPKFLLIPYREFVLRTPISCQTYKLDEPKENSLHFHPKFSKYLNGIFPFVLPDPNVTYDDIEKFYTKILPTQENQNESFDTSFASNITFENIPYRYENSMWYPIEVQSAQRTAIIVPLLGREYNAKTFLFNIHAFARLQLLTYTILFVEQISPTYRFNKGRLLNAGVRYIEQSSLNITCLILHDVDLIPENDNNLYSCESKYPKHTTSRIRQLLGERRYDHYYEFLIGGVLLLTMNMYNKINGFSNLYWGWGGEDDDLSLRLIQKEMCIVRPNSIFGSYVALPHPPSVKNNVRFILLTWAIVRLKTDGYREIDSLIDVMEIKITSTVIHLKLDVNFDQNRFILNKPNEISTNLTTSQTPVDLKTN